MSDTSTESLLGWSIDVERLCKDIECNSSKLSTIHKTEYLSLHTQSKYFKIHIIILSSCNSIFTVGLNAYLNQELVSSVNCLLSLISAIICSIELYIGLQKRIESELFSYRSYYLLSVKINNTLKLEREHRKCVSGADFLTEIETEYKQLFTESLISNQTINDMLCGTNGSTPPFKQKNPLIKKGGSEPFGSEEEQL
jgi:hypothetical protein